MTPSKEDEEILKRLLPASLGLGLGLLFITQAQILKPLSTAIKLAACAVKVPSALQTLHSPTPQTLILASKALIKGFKASSRLIPLKPRPAKPTVTSARLKAFVGSVNLIRCGEFAGLGSLVGGYKISKNFVRVVEGLVGIQLGSAVKQGIEALGLLVRVLEVATEVNKWRGRRKNKLGFGRRADLRRGIYLQYERMNLYGACCIKLPPLEDRGCSCAKDLEGRWTD